ncbi:class I SAM-dependent methyltransferase [Alphaproteobacteria bacterium]|nr:class I SAM-dependent methyltransferase [Alphaproteobacteria bacterium]
MFDHYTNSIRLRYRTRNERNQQAAKLIGRLFGEEIKILNIGSGGEEFLKKALPAAKIFDVDICGKADLLVDLETVEQFDFQDGDFDLAIALDLLEHIENFHAMLKEMFRCTNGHVLISLPNPATSFIRIFRNQKRATNVQSEQGFYEKFYGLPLDKPTDRHKWFFTIDDVRALFEHHVSEGNIDNVQYFSGHSWTPVRCILRAALGKRLYYNLFLPNIWILATKRNQSR